MTHDELLAAHQVLVDRCRNMRADMSAQGLLLDALVIAASPASRATIESTVQQLSERYMAMYLARSTDPSDRSIDAVQQALDRLGDRLQVLPRG
mgnify:CR=1 FL=1